MPTPDATAINVDNNNKWTDKKIRKLLADSDISKIYSRRRLPVASRRPKHTPLA